MQDHFAFGVVKRNGKAVEKALLAEHTKRTLSHRVHKANLYHVAVLSNTKRNLVEIACPLVAGNAAEFKVFTGRNIQPNGTSDVAWKNTYVRS